MFNKNDALVIAVVVAAVLFCYYIATVHGKTEGSNLEYVLDTLSGYLRRIF